MRLWSLDLKFLDQKGLVALWRESLLAKKVLEGKTRGYKNHSQLVRFKSCENPLIAINTYLLYIFNEAYIREYKFDFNKIDTRKIDFEITIPVNSGQLEYEFGHLQNKLKSRDPERFNKNSEKSAEVNSMFYEVPGDVESWEILK